MTAKCPPPLGGGHHYGGGVNGHANGFAYPQHQPLADIWGGIVTPPATGSSSRHFPLLDTGTSRRGAVVQSSPSVPVPAGPPAGSVVATGHVSYSMPSSPTAGSLSSPSSGSPFFANRSHSLFGGSAGSIWGPTYNQQQRAQTPIPEPFYEAPFQPFVGMRPGGASVPVQAGGAPGLAAAAPGLPSPAPSLGVSASPPVAQAGLGISGPLPTRSLYPTPPAVATPTPSGHHGASGHHHNGSHQSHVGGRHDVQVKTNAGSSGRRDGSSLSPSPTTPSSSSSGTTGKKKGKTSTNTELYKTELCASYMSTGGNCPYGEKCQFAHGEAELKRVDRPPKWRSKPCQNWIKNGTCSYNDRCCFRHDAPSDQLSA